VHHSQPCQGEYEILSATGDSRDAHCVRGGRLQGFLRELGLSIDCVFFDDDPPTATLALRDVYREISQRDGARRLRTLKVDLSNMRSVLGDPDIPLACVVQTVNFAELASVRLKTLKIVTDADRFPAGAPFFAALPDLEELLLVSRSYISGDGRLPDFFSQVAPASPMPSYASMLTKLKLQGNSPWWSRGAKGGADLALLRQASRFRTRSCRTFPTCGSSSSTTSNVAISSGS
jgi:hypothetical protein